ncbi:MAG: hypothetical protein ICV84_19260 [Flavisolibacter sp.]|nr:hypothetical protein [Flavisolibacter sp.]
MEWFLERLKDFFDLFKENSFVAFVSFLIGLIGTSSSFYFYYKSEELKRKIKRFEWNEIELGVQYLSKKVLNQFNPDVILAISHGGSIVANLLHKYADRIIPILHVTYYDEERLNALTDRAVVYDTNCIVEIPKSIFALKDKKIAVVDDTVVTGDLLKEVKKKFEENGMTNFKFFVLFASPTAIEGKKGPHEYWKKLEEMDYHLPWGSGYGVGATHVRAKL